MYLLSFVSVVDSLMLYLTNFFDKLYEIKPLRKQTPPPPARCALTPDWQIWCNRPASVVLANSGKDVMAFRDKQRYLAEDVYVYTNTCPDSSISPSHHHDHIQYVSLHTPTVCWVYYIHHDSTTGWLNMLKHHVGGSVYMYMAQGYIDTCSILFQKEHVTVM